MDNIFILLSIGLAAGIFSGMVGIGGGTIIVPALIYFLGFSQYQAQGTTLLMMLFPIGALAVYNYWNAGYVDWKAGCIMAGTFFIGGYFGSKFAIFLDQAVLKKIFACFLVLLAIKMLFEK
ncbi:MAG TPA: sulfite exporter TauE/SafE family protein [Bacteroidia bacterium]|nr:sulfite exporter TauE/SafE family protein [Bacteroidia bacterium]